MSELVIRPITRNDIAPCLDIYNYEVVNGVATLDLEPRTLPEWQEWYESHSDEHHPIVVGTVDGIVAGYASLSPYRPKEAYKSTVELSIYIHQDYRGRGIATQLMTHILEIAKNNPLLHNVVSVITAGNEGSTKLHARFWLYLLWFNASSWIQTWYISGYRNIRIIGIIISIVKDKY